MAGPTRLFVLRDTSQSKPGERTRDTSQSKPGEKTCSTVETFGTQVKKIDTFVHRQVIQHEQRHTTKETKETHETKKKLKRNSKETKET